MTLHLCPLPFINEINSVILYKTNKIIRLSWLKTVKNRRMTLTKDMVTGMSNWVLRLRMRKLEQREALLLDKTVHPIILSRNFEILLSTIGTAMNVNVGVAVYVINLF